MKEYIRIVESKNRSFEVFFSLLIIFTNNLWLYYNWNYYGIFWGSFFATILYLIFNILGIWGLIETGSELKVRYIKVK